MGFGGFYLLILCWLWRNVTTWTSLGAYRSHVSSIRLWYSYGCQIFWVNVLPYCNFPVYFIGVLNSLNLLNKRRTWTNVRKSDTEENVRTSGGGEVTINWRQLHNEEFRELFFWHNTSTLRAGEVGGTCGRHLSGEKWNAYRVLCGNLKERDHFEDLQSELSLEQFAQNFFVLVKEKQQVKYMKLRITFFRTLN